MKLTVEQKIFLDRKLEKLSQSKFRSSFSLKAKDINYINTKTLEKIEEHAIEFVKTRLSPAYIPNDGKQTPMKSHPVFIAQHATATCCRSCLYKWHHIAKNKSLTEKEERFIVSLIMYWIKKQINYVN